MTPQPRRAAFALGSNQGDRLAALQGAVDHLARTRGLSVAGVSHVFETTPVGGVVQPDFLNAVVVGDTDLPPRALLERALDIEEDFGRIRTTRWGPRTLDVDLLAVGDLVLDEPGLQVPHPRARDRAFVMVPWAQVDPGAVLPDGVRITDVAAALDPSGVRERPDLVLALPPLPPLQVGHDATGRSR